LNTYNCFTHFTNSNWPLAKQPAAMLSSFFFFRRVIEEDYRVVATTLTNVTDSDGTTYEELCIVSQFHFQTLNFCCKF